VTDEIEGEARDVGLSVAGAFGGALSLATMSDEEFDRNVALLRKAQDRLLRIMHDVMREGVDYGNVPGVDKPSLAQPGAETLCNLFTLVPELIPERIVGDGVTAPPLYFSVRCNIHAGSVEGPIVGTGVGVCHSWEAKYRYRNAERICPSCGGGHIIKGKAEYGGGWLCWAKRGGCGAKFEDGDPDIEGQQIGQVDNPDPWDLANTLVKMAAKRAHVDATKRTTGASAIFTQDLEEQGALPEEPKPAPVGTVATAAPVVSSADAASLAGAATVSAPTSGQDDGPASPAMTFTELKRRAGQALISMADVSAKAQELFQKPINLLTNEQRQKVAEEVGIA
jgi:hypothetical protein